MSAAQRKKLGAVESARVENHLRVTAKNYRNDFLTGGRRTDSLRRLLGKTPLHETDRQLGNAALRYARRAAWEDLKQSWIGAKPLLPTGPSVGIAAGKNIAANRPSTPLDGIVFPKGITLQTVQARALALNKSRRAVGNTGK